MPQREYDLIVIGAGAIGENVADYAHKRGLSTVIVENELVGGECSYWACMPSKALLRPHAALRAARHVSGAAQAITGSLDVQAVLDRRTSIIGDYDDSGQVGWLDSAGIDLVRGTARIVGVREVVVTTPDGTEVPLTATHAVAVCTGSSAVIPPIDGLAEARPWTSREATSATAVPPRLAVIGGGVVATEMATAYSGLGSAVTVVARSGLLGGNEPFAGELVAAALVADGVTLKTGTSPTSVVRNAADAVEITLADGTSLVADEVLVATGRTPNTAGLGLDTVGLDDDGWLHVDDTLLVTADTNADAPWLYAAGDVNHRALLTHQGKYQARAAGEAIAARAHGETLDDGPWGWHVATADARAVPQVTFTDPEVASVGLTEAQALDAGLRVKGVEYDLAAVAGASVYDDDYSGRAKIVVDLDRDVIVGATFVGADVGELLHAATIAVVGEVPIKRLWHAAPSYPTLSEIWLRLLETLGRP